MTPAHDSTKRGQNRPKDDTDDEAGHVALYLRAAMRLRHVRDRSAIGMRVVTPQGSQDGNKDAGV